VVEIAINPAQMAASLSDIIANLPSILDTLQTISYLLLVFFFGSIAIIGFRIYAPFWKRLILRVVFGCLSLFSGVAIARFMPLPDNIIIKLMQADVLAGGIVAAIIFAVALFILSKALSSEETLKKAIAKLQNRLRKELSKPKPKNGFSSPYFLAGVVIIALFLLFSAFNFTGFPSLQEELLSAFGMTEDDFELLENVLQNVKGINMPDGIADMPGSCYELLGSVGSNPDSMGQLTDYSNPDLKSLIEQETGEDVIDMKRTYVDGDSVIVTITSEGNTCLSTETELCVCN